MRNISAESKTGFWRRKSWAEFVFSYWFWSISFITLLKYFLLWSLVS